jgi:sugar phosphate isomerase/epimerase
MIAAFKTCDDLCEELGAIIAIETHGGIQPNDDGSLTHINSLTTDAPSLRRLIEELPPRVGFNFDPGNLKAVNPEDGRCLLDLLNGRINYCHLKDWSRQGSGWTAVAIGDDDLDYAPLFRDIAFGGIFLVEYEPLHDPIDGIRRSLAYLKKLESENEGLAFVF